jgi:hypothetical protein
MKIQRLECPEDQLVLEGEFDLPSLARLSPEDQVFVMAFIQTHGHIKKMEALFEISYPTVKNRLNAIGAALERSFQAPTPNLSILDQLDRGEIDVEEALRKLE